MEEASAFKTWFQPGPRPGMPLITRGYSPGPSVLCCCGFARVGGPRGCRAYHWGRGWGQGRRTENRDHVYVYVHVCVCVYDDDEDDDGHDDEDDNDDDDADDDDDFETPRATQTANHTTPQGGGGTESRSKPRTTPHHRGPDSKQTQIHTAPRGGGGGGCRPLRGGGRTGIIHIYIHIYIYIYMLPPPPIDLPLLGV